MGLQPLEFSDCYLDSPWFRERIRAHEVELEKTNKFIKELLKDGKNLISATKNLSAAQRKFAHSLRDFKFEFIGDAETDDERCIDASLHEFSNFLKNLEEQREIMALSVTETLIKPLERFRKEQLGAVKDEKKKFDKETEKNYSLLDKHLNMSSKKKESQLQEADNQVEQNRKHFYELSLEYVCKLQEIQERKKFEFVEPMLSFFQGMFTFYHQGYELAKDFNHYKMALQINIQNVNSPYVSFSPIFAIKTLKVQLKRRPAPFGSSWAKHYCMYRKETKKLTMIPFEHRSGGKIGDVEILLLKYCMKRNTDTTDRRFCFDVETMDRVTYLFNFWKFSTLIYVYPVVDTSFHSLIGINDQGLYRVVGVSSKVQRLLSLLMGMPLFYNNFSLLKTSAIFYIPFFPVHVESGSPESRVNAIHFLVHKLPEKNKEMLDILVKHLTNVSNHAKKNLMTVANLGVVFGPTLMRPQEETVAALMDLKFQNIVVEILIENHEKVIFFPISMSISPPNVPPRQSRRQGPRNKRPIAVYNLCLELDDGKLLIILCVLAEDTAYLGPSHSLHIVNRKARAVYPCEAEHSSELSFFIGAVFDDVHFSREPGWLEGTLNGRRGLIPQNYVQFL
uniref:Rho GTPase activating protein 10 n=1 Tax=Sphenodon punctatus TaxID=8508 RepID=A0A8D0GJ52_SPHPU